MPLLLTACSKNESAKAEPQNRPVVTEALLKEFPVGTNFEIMERRLELAKFAFDPQLNQPVGHEQGWYHLPEGDLMISATRNEAGQMVLDAAPWILSKAERE